MVGLKTKVILLRLSTSRKKSFCYEIRVATTLEWLRDSSCYGLEGTKKCGTAGRREREPDCTAAAICRLRRGDWRSVHVDFRFHASQFYGIGLVVYLAHDPVSKRSCQRVFGSSPLDKYPVASLNDLDDRVSVFYEFKNVFWFHDNPQKKAPLRGPSICYAAIASGTASRVHASALSLMI